LIEKEAETGELKGGGGGLEFGEAGFAGGVERAGGGEGGAEGVEIAVGEHFAKGIAEGGRERNGVGGRGWGGGAADGFVT
jgi:hypothetical protein